MSDKFAAYGGSGGGAPDDLDFYEKMAAAASPGCGMGDAAPQQHSPSYSKGSLSPGAACYEEYAPPNARCDGDDASQGM